ncbi:hypothetical protein CIK05_05615 [Bdellovibrio sp. qaytius]|nr:hypothetical protein CIK05_05615 [Bdellovibrio sp. qaytius]
MDIITHTPAWVWAILIYLLFVGYQALKPRTISLYRLILLPIALIALKFKFFTSPDAWIYIVGILSGAFAGYLKVRNSKIQVFKDKKEILIPGSSSLIVILVGIFVMKYFFGFLQVTDPVAYIKYYTWELVMSGILSGYFSGQRLNYLYRYIKSDS